MFFYLKKVLKKLTILSLVFILGYPYYAKSNQNKIEKANWKTHWTRPMTMTDLEIFQSKKRKERLVSVTRTTPVNVNKFSDPERVLQYLILKKKIIESTPSISNYMVKDHSWDEEKKILFLNGTFVRKNKTIFFKEWSFYSSQYSLQILMEDSQNFKKTDQDVVTLLHFLQNQIKKK